ncbi:uncharacterized protein LOC134275130 [Saccostrea cucullata]|uniref:uncharacterized protein LOC134275130 n=1 Tax=Saccostrea cuccullata TaxID=36930 RepID=UPI002ED4DF03
MADDKSSLLKGKQNDLEQGIYYEQSPATISIILSMVRGTELGTYGGGHFMLGITLIGFVVLEIFMIVFIRRGDLPKEKTWFLYFVGGCVILEAIFTDILLYQ